MSSVEDIPWIVRFLTGRGLRVPEELPPDRFPGGWPAWFAAMGYEVGVDFLPLGDPAPEGNRLSMIWTRVGEDVAMIDLSMVHQDGSDTVPFTDDDRDTVSGLAVSLWDDLKSLYDDQIALDRLIYHDFGVDISTPNPARRTQILSAIPGDTTNAAIPPQDAMSVTLKTDHRRSWGRVYLPAPDVASLFAHGNIKSETVDQVRTAFGTFADALVVADLPLVVWSPRHAGELLEFTGIKPKPSDWVLDIPDTTSVARSVSQIQVDDLFDVQRSRRNDKATHVATHTL